MIIEIYNGKGKIYNHRQYIKQNGLKFQKRKYGKSYYTKKINETQKNELIEYCEKHKLKYTIIDDAYLRNTTYRKDFLAQNQHKWTICAYCGRPIKSEKVTIDHIIPVDKVKKNKSYARWLMKKMGINNINNSKNLVEACARCNSKKRTKMGIWLIKGFLGKSKILWTIRWLLRLLIIILIIYYISHYTIIFDTIKQLINMINLRI